MSARAIAPKFLASLAAVCALLVITLAAQTPRAQEASYLVQLPDLPLMPGLTEIEDAGIAFDKPDGRIVEAYAGGPVEARAVRAFYRETLPQLGWRLAGADVFAREGERLRLEFLAASEGLTLRFVLTPQ